MRAAAASATLDLRDGDEAACAQMAKQEGDRRFAGQLRRRLPILLDPSHVDVGNEIIEIGALGYEHVGGAMRPGRTRQGASETAKQKGAAGEEICRLSPRSITLTVHLL
jgi:hypothetical protein